MCLQSQGENQWQQNRNTSGGSGGAGVRGCEAADYWYKASAVKVKIWGGGGAKAPLAPPVLPPLPLLLKAKQSHAVCLYCLINICGMIPYKFNSANVPISMEGG